MNRRIASLAAALCLGAGDAAAACPDAAAVRAYVDDFLAARPSAGFGKAISLAEALCARARLVEALTAEIGTPVGYKAVFTHPDSQRRFGVDGPSWGAMYGRMMLANGARVAAGFGARPRYESDFIVEVKDAGLADAATPLEALEHIDALVPFVELPDLMIEGSIAGSELIATNAAFRGGVLGPRIEVAPTRETLERLANMDVVITEERSGKEIGRAKGAVLMGQPIEAAIWLARALKRDGIALKRGDLLSLGGFLAAAPVKAGTTITVRYLGLPGDPAVTVHFD